MRLLTKIIVLSGVLLADLLFFLVLRTYLPEAFGAVFQMMPWPDDIEKTFAIFTGLTVAVLSSASIAYVLLKRLRESLR